MILPIVTYGNPILRKKGACIEKITDQIHQLITDMLETMRSADGVGLAAQQVGYALQLAVIDIRGSERPSTMEINGKRVDPTLYMPLILINPYLVLEGPLVKDVEGCLSFPGIYAEIPRPQTVLVETITPHATPLKFKCTGFLARAIQHEVDHLNGILFIDRMDAQTREQLREELQMLHAKTTEALKRTQEK